MIPQDTVARILDTAQIVEVVGDFVSLRRRGANYVACCPFHNEKTPSFYVSPAKGIYKCFGCGKSGTAVRFVMEHEGMTYVEALRYLARKYGIEVVEKEESAEEIAARQRTESLYLVSDYAARFFRESLQTEEGRSIGYAYFRSRGLEDETIAKYGLGWAPRSRRALSTRALGEGYKEAYLLETGLCIKNEDGSLADRFYDRVIFPIHSVSGRVIAFGGRTLKSGHPAMKYVNTPTTEIYAKERSLYGIWFAKNEISRRDKCYLVEGYLDVLSMHQLGITNTVASSGTSLTVEQVRLIKKFSSNITIMYDGDAAGIHAALRGIGLILREDMNVKVVLIPDGDDPDSFARKHSLDEVETFIRDAEQDFISFKTDLLLREAGDDPLKRAGLISDIADTIALIPDPVKRTVYVQASSNRFDIDAQILFDRIRNTREKMVEDQQKAALRQRQREAAAPEPDPSAPAPSPEPEPVRPAAHPSAEPVMESRLLAPSERDLLWFLLNHGRDLLAFETDSDFYDPDNTVTVADFIREALEDDNHALVNSWYRKLYDRYFEAYDAVEQPSQAEIIRGMMNSPDTAVADATAQFTQEKYNLTVKNFADSLTNTSTRLAMFVPRSILVYQGKRLQAKVRELTDRLAQTPDPLQQAPILKEIQQYVGLRKRIDERLGRVR